MYENQKFLHNHPGIEQKLGIDKIHVIVDKIDWEFAKNLGKIPHLEFAEWISKNSWTHWENLSGTFNKTRGWYNTCNIKIAREILTTEQLYQKFLLEYASK